MLDALGLDEVGLEPDLAQLHVAQLSHVLDVEDDAERPGLNRIQVSQPDAPGALGGPFRGDVRDQAHAGDTGVGERHLQHQVLGREAHQAFDLALERAGHLVQRLDVPEVPAARLAHGTQQVLVEPGPEPDAGGGDAVAGRTAGHAAKRSWVGDALVGLAIGQEQDPVGPLHDRLTHLTVTFEPAAGEVGASAIVDLADRVLGRGIVAGAGTEEEPDLVIERDHREPVFRRQEGGEAERRLPGVGQRLAGHGAGAVEHQGDVDRRSLDRNIAGEGDEEAHPVAVVGGGEGGADGGGGFHG